MASPQNPIHYAPGMRIVVRDTEWLVKSVDIAKDTPVSNPTMLTCIGISNLVSGREARFLCAYEDNITILDPKTTDVVQDPTGSFELAQLYIDTQLRRTPATDTKIHIAQEGALDVMPYQLVPALEALKSIRPRILIADAVGIGKTMEAGILVSELIARHRGKRILVLTVKAMLQQFQQEFWNRFSIPLTCLDSNGIAQLMQNIPAGQNPFLYVDKAIVSIDTLKNLSRYGSDLESADWDIIIIDEAHNIAERNGSGSFRSKLAKLLAKKSDTLIMLTATPHDGRPESFASLINMLDPTVIRDPSHYTKEDFLGKGLVIRRFKNDVREQVKEGFQERDIAELESTASPKENEAYDALNALKFTYIDSNRKAGSFLFKTVLEKALFSSPAACLSTIRHRIKRLEGKGDTARNDIEALQALVAKVTAIRVEDFSKFQLLVKLLKEDADYHWTGKDAEDRLVIFTESRETLDFLKEQLPKAIGIANEAVCVLKGDDSDKDLMKAVEDFNLKTSSLRLMLASDVASEGLNLHKLCHRLIHFDIPWSLMTFQQRNGRVDRYGQKARPIIRYLKTATTAADGKYVGDQHILDILVTKDNNASQNIGDPREFTGTRDEQEAYTALQIEMRQEPQSDEAMEDVAFDIEAMFMEAEARTGTTEEQDIVPRKLLFADYDFFKTGLNLRKNLVTDAAEVPNQTTFDDATRTVSFDSPKSLQVRLKFLPKEVHPADKRFTLSADSSRVQKVIREAGSMSNSKWPEVQLLWELHPVMQWMEDWALCAFGRHTAPVLHLPDRLCPGEIWYLIQGGFPNVKGNIPVHDWIAVHVAPDGAMTTEPRRVLMEKLTEKPLVNSGEAVDLTAVKKQMPKAVEAAAKLLAQKKADFEARTAPVLAAKLEELDKLRKPKVQTDLFSAENMGLSSDSKVAKARAENQLRREADIDASFASAKKYAKETFSLNDEPYLQVVAVLMGAPLAAPEDDDDDESRYLRNAGLLF